MFPVFALGNSGVVWSAPIAVAGLVLLFLAIRRLIRTIQEAVLLKVPLQESSVVTFEEAGRVQLHSEGPRFSFAFTGIHYEMFEIRSGSAQRLPVSRTMSRMRSSGFETERVLYGEVLIPEPGRYEIRVHGIKNPQDAARCSIVFTRPYAAAMTLCILGIVFSAMALIGGIVASGLFLSMAKHN